MPPACLFSPRIRRHRDFRELTLWLPFVIIGRKGGHKLDCSVRVEIADPAELAKTGLLGVATSGMVPAPTAAADK